VAILATFTYREPRRFGARLPTEPNTALLRSRDTAAQSENGLCINGSSMIATPG